VLPLSIQTALIARLKALSPVVERLGVAPAIAKAHTTRQNLTHYLPPEPFIQPVEEYMNIREMDKEQLREGPMLGSPIGTQNWIAGRKRRQRRRRTGVMIKSVSPMLKNQRVASR